VNNPPPFEDTNNIARKVAGYYKRLFTWVDHGELVNEAWVSLLVAWRTYRPDRGTWPSYGGRAAGRAVRDLISVQRTMLSDRSKRHGENLSGKMRFTYDAQLDTRTDECFETTVIRGMERRLIRGATLAASEHMAQPYRKVALSIVLEGVEPQIAGARHGLSAEQASWAARRLRGFVKKRGVLEVLR
jgi:hypothetical protein